MADDERASDPPGGPPRPKRPPPSVPPPPPRRGGDASKVTPPPPPPRRGPTAPPPPAPKKRSVPPPPPPARMIPSPAAPAVEERSSPTPPPPAVAKPAAAAPKPAPMRKVERAPSPPAPEVEPVAVDRPSAVAVEQLLEASNDAAEHKPTRMGMGDPTPDPRTETALRTIAALESELARATEPLREGRLHYELARLYESPLRDIEKAATHYTAAYRSLPDHVPTLRGTRRVLLAQRSFGKALPLFDAEVRFTSDAASKAVLLYEKARVLEDHMGQKREARDAFLAALELDPSNPTVLKAVERVEHAAAAWDSLDRTYELAANAVAQDPKLRAVLVAERARLAEARKGDSQGAAELYQAALAFDDRAAGALHALKRLHTAHRRWRDLVEVLRKEADQASDPVVRAMACYRMGRVLVDRLGNLDEGIAALERAADSVPDEVMVLEELSRLYELAKNWGALARVLERLSAKAETAAQRVGFLHRIGQIVEEHLEQEAEATQWYGRALAEDPTYLPALAALGKLYTRRQDWQALIRMHLGEAGATKDSARRAAAHARVATLYEEQLGDTEQSVAHHARALGLSPGHAPSFKALARLYREGERFRELAELYERAVDEAKDDETRITYLFKIGRLHEDALGAPHQALGAYRRVLEVDPNHLGAIHALQRAAERGLRWKELVAALELEAEKLRDDSQVVALLHRAGEILEDHLGDTEAALARYRRVIGKRPGYAPALASLGLIYYRAGRWEDLLDVYKKELETTPRGPEAAALLYKMGELSEDRIGKDDDAIAYYRRAIEMDAFHRPALHALGRKLSERSHWAELAKLIELELSGLKDDSQRVRTAFRLGEVYENRLNQPEKALQAYEQALAVDAKFRPALDGRVRLLTQARDFKRLVEELDREAATADDLGMAIAALFRQGEIWRDELNEPKRAIDCFEAVLAKDPSHVGALLAVEPLYLEMGAWEALSRVYSAQSRVLSDVGARVAALRELGRLQESRGLGGPDQQRATHIAVLQLAPSDPTALAALERLALELPDAQLLTHVDAKLGAVSPINGLAAAHQTRLAETLEAIGDPSALDTYRAALARDAENIAAALGIVRIAVRGRDAELLASAAETTAKVLDDRALAARLLVQAAELRAGSGQTDAAMTALERALELNPDDAKAAAELERLLLAVGKIDRLFDALCQAAQWASDPERMAALWISVSRLLADQKRDVPAALAALHRVTEELSGHVPTLLALADLYQRDHQWAEAVDRLQKVLAQKPDARVKVRAHLELAGVLHDHLGDEARALANIEKVLELDDKHPAALERMLEIQHRRGQHDAAAATAARLVAVADSDAARAEALCRLARLEHGLKKIDGAAHAYEQAVALTGVDGIAAKEFRELLQEQKLLGEDPPWSHYVGALTGYLERPNLPPEKRAQVMVEISDVLADEMAQMDRAVAALSRALALEPDNVAMRIAHASRLAASRNHAQAIDEYRKLLSVNVTRPETWRELAASYTALGRTEEAALAMAPLVALGVGNDLERATISSRPSRFPMAQPGAFDAAAFRGIDARGAHDVASDLLAAVAEALPKVHPPELERYGLSSRDKLTTRSGHPTRLLADRVARVFGVQEFDLYVHRAHAGALEVELTDPPAILVPQGATQLGEIEQVFLLCRPMANLSRGLHAVNKLSPREVELLLIAAARAADPTFGMGAADEEFLREHAKRVQKALSRRGRRQVEETAALYLGAARIDFTDWAEKIRRTAGRAAVVVADDLPASITLVRRTEGDLAGLKGAALAQGMAQVDDLMRFWISDAAMALRRRLGMV